MPAGPEQVALGPLPSIEQRQPSLQAPEDPGTEAGVLGAQVCSSRRQSRGSDKGPLSASRTSSLAQRLHSDVSVAASYSMASGSGQSSTAGVDIGQSTQTRQASVSDAEQACCCKSATFDSAPCCGAVRTFQASVPFWSISLCDQVCSSS